MELDSGFCAYCYNPHATIGVGSDDNGDAVFVHGNCEEAYLRRVLGRSMIDLARRNNGKANGSEDADMVAP